MMNSSNFIGCQALADFFGSMVMQKAHWYSMTNPSSDMSSNKINLIFPTLSMLLSVGPEIMDSVLQLCRLTQVTRGKAASIMNAWKDFIAEKRVDIKSTTFSISNRRWYFIRIGSWNKIRHPPKLPLSCWREKILAPKLRISGLTKAFAWVVWI